MPASPPDVAPGPDGRDGQMSVEELSQFVSSWQDRRRRLVAVLICAFVLAPIVTLVADQGLTGKAVFLVPASVLFVVSVCRGMFSAKLAVPDLPRGLPWFALILALGGAIFAVSGMNELTALAVAAAACGNRLIGLRLAAVGIAVCCAVGLAIPLWQGFGYANTLAGVAVPALAGLLSYSAARRNELVSRLAETRAELARMAVAEERLRISRDLHDLLGHSLSLISLKAELAGRLIGTDTGRAAREISELETVARRSLTEVRQAVTSYRQPSLAAELGAARRMLASAGVECRADVPRAYSLPPAIDALLAWAVREGTTNIVRHAAARHADITIELAAGHAAAVLTDDGAGLPGGPTGRKLPGLLGGQRAPVEANGEQVAAVGGAGAAGGGAGAEPGPALGSGLAGLAERAARLGGTLSAGPGPHGGFRLAVSVPLADAGEPADPGEPAAATGSGQVSP